MENASKALIIAGAILISIVLISVGIMVVNGASDTTSEAVSQMGDQAIESFNKQFTAYEGKQRGSQVTALIDKIISNNTKYKDDDVKKINILIEGITVTDADGATVSDLLMHPKDSTSTGDTYELSTFKKNATALKKAIKSQSTYEITIETDDDFGYVDSITITK